MSKIKLSSNASGTGNVTISSTATNSDRTITLPDGDGAMPLMKLETAKTATGTAVDFTGIPAWVKRITVMFSGVSTNGTSNILLRLGDAGGIEDTGYASGSSYNGADAANSTGFLLLFDILAAVNYNGAVTFSKLDGNTYSSFGGFSNNSTAVWSCAGAKTLSDTLTQIRITTVNGTDTFDAGTINIMYEG